MMAQKLYYAAAAATAVAGLLHMVSFSNAVGSNINTAILFGVGGIAQVFWVVPMIRKWGLPWYLVGIGGTAVFIAIWTITRMPDNPITGRGGPVSPMGLAVELAQLAFIGMTAAIIALEKRMKQTKSNVPEA